MYTLNTTDKLLSLTRELRSLEFLLLSLHKSLAAEEAVLYASLTTSSAALTSAIAVIPTSLFVNMPAIKNNWRPLFRPNFSVAGLLSDIRDKVSEMRIHEGVRPEISQFQMAQQKLLMTHREIALVSAAVSSVLLGIKRSDATQLAELNPADILNVNYFSLLWSLPFRRSHELEFYTAVIVGQTTQDFANDLYGPGHSHA